MNKKNKLKRIGVIYNAPLIGADKERSLGDVDTVLTAEEVEDALIKKGYEVVIKCMSDGEDSFPEDVDLIFNICEWTGEETYKSCRVLERLNDMGMPFTGADAKNYYETSDKLTMKKKLVENGINTPGWQILEDYRGIINPDLKYPIIVKLANEHGSVGITQNSVVENEDQLRGQIEYMVRKYKQPVLIEEFIVGREMNVTMVGNGKSLRVLPVTEMDFGNLNRKWNILTFSSKFLDRSEEYKESRPVYPPKNMSKTVLSGAAKLSKKAFERFGCHDYARMDLRVDENGKSWILEVNSNPSLENAWISSMVSAKVVGWTYDDVIEQIALAAWKRCVYSENVKSTKHGNYDFVQQAGN
jgi:D-alanine-D-alanine ligase